MSLLAVAQAFFNVGQAMSSMAGEARAATGDLRKMNAEAARTTTSRMTKDPKADTSTKGMGASSSASSDSSFGTDGPGGSVTTSGLGMALQSLRGRVP